MFPESSPWRHGIWVLGLVATVWVACFCFPSVWVVTGIGEANRPFMDLHGILAARDAVRAGVDPFLPNDFDPYHRPHVYSTWWLAWPEMGLGRADTLWLGGWLLGLVLVMTVSLVRPRTAREGGMLALMLCSPALLLAVNRANNDLTVFVLISLGLFCFRSVHRVSRALGILLFATAAVLKYSPLVTLVVLLDLRTRRELIAGLGLYALVLLLAWPGLLPGLKSAAQFMPAPEWLYSFGAPILMRNLGINQPLAWLLPAIAMGVWAVALAYRKTTGVTPSGTPAQKSAEREFICGAAMLVGLFFVGSSYAYKFIFALWLLPWLWRECGDDVLEARWGRVIWGLLLAVLWLEGGIAVAVNLVIGSWSLPVAEGLLKATIFTAQLLTWALVACLLRFLLIYLGRRGRALLRPAVNTP